MHKNIPSGLKLSNRKIVYRIIAEKDGLSRADIARMTGISGATVMKIMDYLRDKNIICYDPAENIPVLGRKPWPIRFNSNFAYIIAIYMEGFYTSIGIVNMAGEIVMSEEIKVPDADRFIQEDFYSYIDAVITKSAIDKSKLLGIGVAIPVAVDVRSKQVFRAPLFHETQLANLRMILEQLGSRYSLPVFVENDVNAAAYGEYRQVYHSKTNDLIYISLGSGVGSGLILNKEIWKGQNASAGEIGYMLFDQRSSASPDALGWLESRINFKALEDMFQIDVRGSFDHLTGQKIAQYLARYISLAILNMFTVLDIETVVLGGRLTICLSDYLIGEVYREMEKLSAYLPKLVYGTLSMPGFTGLSHIIADNLLDEILAGY